MLSRLRHPNIVQPLATLGSDDFTDQCLVLELMPGGGLRSYLATVGDAIDTATFFSIAMDVAAALEYLHSQDIAVS